MNQSITLDLSEVNEINTGLDLATGNKYIYCDNVKILIDDERAETLLGCLMETLGTTLGKRAIKEWSDVVQYIEDIERDSDERLETTREYRDRFGDIRGTI